MIDIQATGDFDKMAKTLEKMRKTTYINILNHYGAVGVAALANATPVESGITAGDWTYTIQHKGGYHTLAWHNTNTNDGAPIAILLQYGHGTGTGGWVEGRDYINPAIRPVFDQIAEELWRQVRDA